MKFYPNFLIARWSNMKAVLFSILILFFAIHLQASEKPFQRFSALPVLAYSEETSLQYGAMLLLFFKPVEGGTQVSTIDLVALGSLENQYQLRTKPHFYFLGDKLFLPSEFSISKWCGSIYERSAEGSFDPLDDYENFHFYGKLPFEMNFGIPNSLPVRYGLVFETDYRENTLDSAWQISKRFQDGFFAGVGYSLAYDSRDNFNWPMRGFYARFEENFYFGDFSFHREKLDFRTYFPIIWNTTFSIGALWQQSRGSSIPFDYLSGPDGTARFRGVDSHIWNDTQAMIWQFELRKTLFWRLAGTIFFETLQSGPHFGKLFSNQIHTSVGLGGRLALNRSEKLYARGDISLIDGKHIGLTIYLREAF